ncbi:hypothetical protein NQ318_014029 [Aromia moschata]|uniref:Uncharacterized protein n=1 Tax=Aromia moschata TaxID=1265417 RepID=A0AAV8YY44_9CUCU|nr:hypothetical protein NQ318_014029 [Aromia moschata]
MYYIGTCWVTTALSGLLFFMLVLLLMSALTTGGHRLPRCTSKEEINNDTIHLVHTHHPEEWRSEEVDLFEKIVENYSQYKIHLILIQRTTPHTKRDYATEEEKHTTESRKKRKIDDLRLSINMGAKRLLDILLHGKSVLYNSTEKLTRTTRSVPKSTMPFKTLDDLLKVHPNIILENTTYNQIFFMSPLYAYWSLLNENLKVFAVRTLQLWQYGGISFDLEPHSKSVEKKTNNSTEAVNNTSSEKEDDNIFKRKLLNFVISEKNNYEKLPTGVVTADDEALHMESKIPCHAFFGEIMMHLRRAQENTTVKDILQESLKVFCRHSAADKKYCDILKKMH